MSRNDATLAQMAVAAFTRRNRTPENPVPTEGRNPEISPYPDFREARRTDHPCDGPFLARGCGWEFQKSFSGRRVIKAAIVIPPLVRSEAVIRRR